MASAASGKAGACPCHGSRRGCQSMAIGRDDARGWQLDPSPLVQLAGQRPGGRVLVLAERGTPVRKRAQLVRQSIPAPLRMETDGFPDLGDVRRLDAASLDDARADHGTEDAGRGKKSSAQNLPIIADVNPASLAPEIPPPRRRAGQKGGSTSPPLRTASRMRFVPCAWSPARVRCRPTTTGAGGFDVEG